MDGLVRRPCRATCIAAPRCRSRRTARLRPPDRGPRPGVTTIGFLPPSSRHGDCRWPPHSSPMLRPASVEPVNPTLCRRPWPGAGRAPRTSSPRRRGRRGAPDGRPPRTKRLGHRVGDGGGVFGGLPDDGVAAEQRRDEIPARYGRREVPAVMIAATPMGTRNVNSCLSGISDGTVIPYSRRPSLAKNVQVSMTSCTSPSDSAYGLPISRVISRASASLFDSTRRPICCTARPRTGAGTAAHVGCA